MSGAHHHHHHGHHHDHHHADFGRAFAIGITLNLIFLVPLMYLELSRGGFLVSLSLLGFLFFGIFYSAPPIRAKEIPFLDSFFNILYVFPGIAAYLVDLQRVLRRMMGKGGEDGVDRSCDGWVRGRNADARCAGKDNAVGAQADNGCLDCHRQVRDE
jgi:hypothetical protein